MNLPRQYKYFVTILFSNTIAPYFFINYSRGINETKILAEVMNYTVTFYVESRPRNIAVDTSGAMSSVYTRLTKAEFYGGRRGRASLTPLSR